MTKDRSPPFVGLTSLLIQHNQSPDAGIFALFPEDSQVKKKGEGGGRKSETKQRSVMRPQQLRGSVATEKYELP